MSEPLDWTYRTTEVPEGGLRETRPATDVERVALAAALEVVSCEHLQSAFVIRAMGQGRFRVAGDLSARLTQSCVITLDPIAQSVEGTFDVLFSPADQMPEPVDDEVEALSVPEIEPIVQGRIDIGRIVFETLSAAIDPYPRKDGAQFDPAELGAAAVPSETGPFAALKKLKDRG